MAGCSATHCDGTDLEWFVVVEPQQKKYMQKVIIIRSNTTMQNKPHFYSNTGRSTRCSKIPTGRVYTFRQTHHQSFHLQDTVNFRGGLPSFSSTVGLLWVIAVSIVGLSLHSLSLEKKKTQNK
jgi:hypothetical protein